MNDREFEEQLLNEINDLEKEISPARDLWPGINHAINSNTVTISRPLAIAASLLLAVSLVISGGLLVNTSRNETRGVEEFIALLQSDHERNKQALLVEYQNQTALAPDWEGQMEQLEQAEQAIYEALKDDTENIELLKILRQVQTKQIQLIESVYAPLFTAI